MPDQNKIKAAAVLKNNILAGVEDLDSGRFQVYDDATLMRLADEVSLTGRKRLNATVEANPNKAYNQDDATGFIRLNALRLKVAAKVQRRK